MESACYARNVEIMLLTDENLSEAAEKAARILKRGGVVLFPTDTVYGLAADAQSADALNRIRAIKGREAKKPIAVIVHDHDALTRHIEVDETVRTLAAKHLPGPLTIVGPSRGKVHPSLLLNDTIGVRIPKDVFSRTLARIFGRAFAATSANKSRHPVPHTVEGVLEQLGPMVGHIDLVVDAGPHEHNTPSTVVLVRNGEVFITREGALSKADLGL